jgi:uncharacterized membrane protein YgcG
VRKLLSFLVLYLTFVNAGYAQSEGGYFISSYNVSVKVNKDASLDVTETIEVYFESSKHGIFRDIPYRYRTTTVDEGTEKADRSLTGGGYNKTIIEDISVDGWNYSVSNEGDYKHIKIGSKNKYVEGRQEYVIHYRMLNAISFFKDHSEMYFNVIGDKWDARIEHVNFSIELYNSLPAEPRYFVSTGYFGSKENNSSTRWSGNKTLSGLSTSQLGKKQGLTVGIIFPDKFLDKPDFFFLHVKWMIMPAILFFLSFFAWRRWGKDEKLTITTEFYPPAGTSPSVAGYVIDDRLDRRDLTALIPYWGGGGYLKIREAEHKDYEFIKVKDLPGNAMSFEKTLFDGIFASGDNVMLSSLKNVLYTSMNTAKSQLEAEVDKGAYYEKGSRGWGGFMVLLGLVLFGYGIWQLFKEWGDPLWHSIAFISSGVFVFAFGLFMPKKTRVGNDLYQKLAGFKEFITMVEKPRLEQFLKEDEHYFDKVLPFAIVFDVADKWKDKLKDMDIPPPNWYAGNYSNFTTYMFLSSLDHSMERMTDNFYSAPSSSGTSGGSWSGGGGGFSGGGFGGGGGGSW